MEQQNYHNSITVDKPAHAAFAAIADVAAWWAKNFKGSALKTGETFTVHFGDTWVAFEMSDVIPDKKAVWKVTDCYLPWLKDKTEWTNTEVIWNITTMGGATRIDMVHVGLEPNVECFESCRKGWNEHINGSLYKLLTTGEGQPT